MAFREGPLQDGRTPLVWVAAGAAVIALVISLVILLADKREAMARTGHYGAARTEFDELAAPVMGALSAPIRLLSDASTDVRGYFFAVSENRRLRARVKEMERWRDAAIALKNVNERYEQLLKLRTEPPIPMVAARVIADARGPFSNARLADAGTAAGVRNGQPVVSDHGVVGRVVGAGEHASRILLLSDVDSRTPVLNDRTNARAILTGDGGPTPRLEYLRGDTPTKEGDILLTSGDGGVFPRGLPIGVAAKDPRGVWRARLYADRQALDYVQVLTYVDFGKLAHDAALAAQAPPPLDPVQQAQLQAALAARAAPPPGTAPPPAARSPAAAAPPAPAVAPLKPPVAPPAAARRPAAAAEPGLRTRTEDAAPPPRPKPRPKPAAEPPTDGEEAASAAKPQPKPKLPKPTTPRPSPAAEPRRSTSDGPPGETAEERATRLRLRALTRDARKPAASMKPIPDPRDEDR